MTEYFELYRIHEDGETEHINQFFINGLNVWETITHDPNFPTYDSDPYNYIYNTELKKFILKYFPKIIHELQENNKSLDIMNDDIEIKMISSCD